MLVFYFVVSFSSFAEHWDHSLPLADDALNPVDRVRFEIRGKLAFSSLEVPVECELHWIVTKLLSFISPCLSDRPAFDLSRLFFVFVRPAWQADHQISLQLIMS